ncbi:HlyD_D23 domain-containing protein [Vibrio chagasii]|nr:HlyD_D23 domain-containing protein [Vibrio chagasii]CAH7120421.1 HlyD_D23 domain-containing protein [Vibrio chagasii]CAH7138286.1 HlyD_D23 domain-containing protein [Vibrio chagasii]CAH7151123.1 HlyD_D23 domain-containing protein [Vibrio chagasii]
MKITTPTLKKVVAPILVLSLAGGSAWHLMASTPKSQRAKPVKVERLVDTYLVEKNRVNIELNALATVSADKMISIYPEVSGQVIAIKSNLVAGSRITHNESVIELDNTEYLITRQEMKATVVEAQSELKLELGRQSIAKKEYQLTGHKLTENERALVMRLPQLEAAKANVNRAKANLAKAELDLARTQIRAPFSGQVMKSNVHIGSRVSTSSDLLQLVSTDRFLLTVELPETGAQWLEYANQNGKGSSVSITSSHWNGQTRHGEVLSIAPNMDSQSRMISVVVAIADPLALLAENQGKPRVMINDLLDVTLKGKALDNVSVLPDELMRSDNQVWIMNQDDKLEIRSVTPVFRNATFAYIGDELKVGERVVSSYLGSPVSGMPLRTAMKTIQNPQQEN